jgi:PEP-CTERM motif
MAVAVPVLGGSVQAETITFDGPGYVAGSVAPSPWLEEYGHTTGWGILPGAGVDGSQALYNGDSSGSSSNVAYDLPTPLTSLTGVQRVSILFNPAGPTSSANFTDYGGVQVGNGSHMYGTGNYAGVIFRKTGANSYGIYGPGGGYGTYMAAFAPSSSANWFEITFETNDAWSTMTLGVGLVGQTPATLVTAWDGSDISRIWAVRDDMRFVSQPAVYDNLVITPEPASMALVGCGLIGVLARRRKAHA